MVKLNTKEMKISIFTSVRSKGEVCNQSLLNAKTSDPSLVALCEEIATCGDKEEQQRLKKKLPGVTWQAWFPKGRRVNAEAQPSGLYMVDYDRVEDPEQAYSDKIAGREEALGIMVVHITPSRKGLRVVGKCRPEFATIAENQRWLSSKIGLTHDAACKDLARFSYLVPDDYFLYWDERIWEMEAEAEPMVVSEGSKDSKDSEVSKDSKASGVSDAMSTQDRYRGIALKDIACKWLEKNGGEPQVGERNSVLFTLATRMRYICEFDPVTIAANIPHCGLEEQEVMGLCRNACSIQRTQQMPEDLRRLLTEMKRKEVNTSDVEGGSFEDYLLRMPRLPKGLKESLIGVPDKMKLSVLCGVLPAAATLATGVTVRYSDGMRQRLNLMCIVTGQQASGKSSVKSAVDLWVMGLREQDSNNRQIEDQYQELRKRRKANVELPEEPKLPIRTVPITISNAVLLKRLKNAKGKHLFSFDEELDTLIKTNKAGSWSMKLDAYRKGFDNALWGQDFMSDQSEKGEAQVAYNWTVLGTPGSVKKMFTDENVENGLCSRILFSIMPSHNYEHLSIYDKGMSETDTMKRALAIGEAARYLEGCEGFVDTPKLRKTIEKWTNALADEAAKEEDNVLDTFRRRAGVIGFRCGVIYQLLDNWSAEGCNLQAHHESKGSLDFATLMADYVLQNLIDLFGQQLQEVTNRAWIEPRSGSNMKLYQLLPDEFEYSLLQVMKPEAQYGALRQMVSKWVKDGLAKKKGKDHWLKVHRD